MRKLKKSELKKHLDGSVKILKRTLDYTTYHYFILAMLFFYHTDQRASYGRTIISVPRQTLDIQDGLIEAFSNLERANPALRGVLLPAIPQPHTR